MQKRVRVRIVITHVPIHVLYLNFSDIIIATVNCQGLATLSKRKCVIDYYKQKQHSIIYHQDTRVISNNESLIESH